jgi:hypothetical protein
MPTFLPFNKGKYSEKRSAPTTILRFLSSICPLLVEKLSLLDFNLGLQAAQKSNRIAQKYEKL